MTTDYEPRDEETFEPENRGETRHIREQIDLLLDGELDERDRKTLLKNLDAAPGGWKDCALAFLESQMFSQSLRKFRGRAMQSGTSASTPATSRTPESRAYPQGEASPECSGQPPSMLRRRRRFPITLVASLTAFVLGGLLFSVIQRGSPQNSESFTTLTGPFEGQASPPLIAEHHSVPGTFVSQVSDKGNPFPLHAADSPFVTVTPKIQCQNGLPRTEYVSLPQGDGQDAALVPCYLASDIEADRYLKSPPLISPHEMEFIHRHGSEVNIHREHVVVPAGENRHAVIPVDRVIVSYSPELDVL